MFGHQSFRTRPPAQATGSSEPLRATQALGDSVTLPWFLPVCHTVRGTVSQSLSLPRPPHVRADSNEDWPQGPAALALGGEQLTRGDWHRRGAEMASLRPRDFRFRNKVALVFELTPFPGEGGKHTGNLS